MDVSPRPAHASAGWCWMLFQLLVLPSLLRHAQRMLPWSVSDAALNFAFYSINFLAVSLIFRDFWKESFLAAKRCFPAVLRCGVLGLVACAAATRAVTAVAEHFLPAFFNVNNQAIVQLSRENPLLMAFGTIILTPPTEECFYRVLLFRQLYPRSPSAAWAVSVGVFAAVHVVGYLGACSATQLAVCFVQYLPAGACLCWAYAKSGTVLTPVFMHAIINAQSTLHLLR